MKKEAKNSKQAPKKRIHEKGIFTLDMRGSTATDKTLVYLLASWVKSIKMNMENRVCNTKKDPKPYTSMGGVYKQMKENKKRIIKRQYLIHGTHIYIEPWILI